MPDKPEYSDADDAIDYEEVLIMRCMEPNCGWHVHTWWPKFDEAKAEGREHWNTVHAPGLQ